MSKTVPMILEGSITGVKGLETRPVYFLKLNGAKEWNLVVKMDAKNRQATDTTEDAAVSIKWGSKLMKNVNNKQVNTKIMTPDEVNIFKAVGQRVFDTSSIQFENLQKVGPVFVKMPYVPGLTDSDMFNEKMGGNDMKLIKANIRRFSDEAVWTALGKVVAVDLFIGNNDRFDSNGRWVNKGNIMFQEILQSRTVLGLDTFDYNSGAKSNLNTGGGFDALQILIDPVRQNSFARKCLRSVGKVLRDLTKKVGAQKVTIQPETSEGSIAVIEADAMESLFDLYVPSFERGLQDGAEKLRVTLQTKARQYAQTWVPTQMPGQQGQPAQGQGPGQAQPPVRQGFLGHARLGGVLPQPQPQAQPQAGYVPLQPVQQQAKTFPQGILDRMAYLGWDV